MALTHKPVEQLTYAEALGNFEEAMRHHGGVDGEYANSLKASPQPVAGEEICRAAHRRLAARIVKFGTEAARLGVVCSDEPGGTMHIPV